MCVALILLALCFVLLTLCKSSSALERFKVSPACPNNCVHKVYGRWVIVNNCSQTCGPITIKNIIKAMKEYKGQEFM